MSHATLNCHSATELVQYGRLGCVYMVKDLDHMRAEEEEKRNRLTPMC